MEAWVPLWWPYSPRRPLPSAAPSLGGGTGGREPQQGAPSQQELGQSRLQVDVHVNVGGLGGSQRPLTTVRCAQAHGHPSGGKVGRFSQISLELRTGRGPGPQSSISGPLEGQGVSCQGARLCRALGTSCHPPPTDSGSGPSHACIAPLSILSFQPAGTIVAPLRLFLRPLSLQGPQVTGQNLSRCAVAAAAAAAASQLDPGTRLCPGGRSALRCLVSAPSPGEGSLGKGLLGGAELEPRTRQKEEKVGRAPGRGWRAAACNFSASSWTKGPLWGFSATRPRITGLCAPGAG